MVHCKLVLLMECEFHLNNDDKDDPFILLLFFFFYIVKLSTLRFVCEIILLRFFSLERYTKAGTTHHTGPTRPEGGRGRPLGLQSAALDLDHLERSPGHYFRTSVAHRHPGDLLRGILPRLWKTALVGSEVKINPRPAGPEKPDTKENVLCDSIYIKCKSRQKP